MKHRIRAAVLILNKNKILLVKHVHPDTGFSWWVPPGGGVEEKDGSIFDCMAREAFEETGLDVNVNKLAYIREFFDEENKTLNAEFFAVVDSYKGEITLINLENNGPDELFIKEVKWLSRDELQNKVVFPEILKDDFWNDYKNNFSEVKYLGRQK